MSLQGALVKYYYGKWKTFPCPTDTINDYDNINWISDPPSKKEVEQKIQLFKIETNIENCKIKAKKLLVNSDWTELPSIIEEVTNIEQWKRYRSIVRNYFINPIEDPKFPDEPETIWKNK